MGTTQQVVYVDGVRTPFGKAGSALGGARADDLVVNALRSYYVAIRHCHRRE